MNQQAKCLHIKASKHFSGNSRRYGRASCPGSSVCLTTACGIGPRGPGQALMRSLRISWTTILKCSTGILWYVTSRYDAALFCPACLTRDALCRSNFMVERCACQACMPRLCKSKCRGISAEVNDLKRDHPHLEYVIKDLYHSLRIVSEALDPTHPLAGKLILGMVCMFERYCICYLKLCYVNWDFTAQVCKLAIAEYSKCLM